MGEYHVDGGVSRSPVVVLVSIVTVSIRMVLVKVVVTIIRGTFDTAVVVSMSMRFLSFLFLREHSEDSD